MTPEELERWKTKQIAAAIACGVHPLDATRAMDEFLASVPPGTDPKTYIRPARELEQPITQELIDDAKAAWYGSVEPRMARLLDAKEAE